jgi:hypothetical protein
MKINFPSRDFDDAVATVCHGSASDEQVQALNEILRHNPAARDEYILRLELHSRLASEPDLFASTAAAPAVLRSADEIAPRQNVISARSSPRGGYRRIAWTAALAACVTLLATGLWILRHFRPAERTVTTSKAVAMLNRTADAQWSPGGETPRLNAPLEPGWLKLQSGLAQIVFYSGARVVIEGPAEFQLISQSAAACRRGRIVADVPPQARGFRVETPATTVTDLGTAFGLEVKEGRTDLHVFQGSVKLQVGAATAEQNLREGAGAVLETSRPTRIISANPAAFASLFDLQARSVAAEALRYDHWRTTSRRLDNDPSLLVHLDFENVAPSGWQLNNTGNRDAGTSDATIVGCQWAGGRWPDKRALEFHGVSDRVRLSLPGEFQSVTLAAWVCVKGLDRKINSLFMCDGFEPGTIHWLIRRDGVLGLTVIGANAGHYQITASPPVLSLEKFGQWLHLAVVLDGKANRVVHYVNGSPVGENALKIKPPFRIGTAELGNWNAQGFPNDDPFMIRNFSGAMDEFCLFSRALEAGEIRALYSAGKPQSEPLVQSRN